MKAAVYNQKGKEVDTALLPKEIFDVPLNKDLLHQAVASYSANKRRKIAHTKDRREVRGGGKKPWRQKGTGRARHGSIRSPLWKGGGVTFGPRTEKVFYKVIPQKIRRKALFMVLSVKAKENTILLLDNLEIEKPKTKNAAEVLKNLPKKSGSVLIAVLKKEKNMAKAGRNIANTEIAQVKDLNAFSVLSSKYLIMGKDAIKEMKETFLSPVRDSGGREKEQKKIISNGVK